MIHFCRESLQYITIITTDSDMYYDCVLTTQDGKYITSHNENDINRHLLINLEVKGECYVAEYDAYNDKYINCFKDKVQKVVPYVIKYGNICVPDGDEFELGYVDAIRLMVPKRTFCDSGMVKISVCNIEHDTNFKDKTQEVWSIKDITTIKYKSYE